MHKKLSEKFKPIAEKLNVRLIFAFGSQARGDHRNGSDLDVAFLADKKLSLDEKFALQQALTPVLGQRYVVDSIDLIDMRTAPPLLSRQIVQDGILLYGSEDAVDQFYRTTIKRYIDAKPLYKLTHAYINEQVA